jgi:hypothetical protein
MADDSQKKIDQLLNKAMSKAKAESATLDDMLDTLKVAIAWEKVKNGLNIEEEGGFFGSTETRGRSLKEAREENDDE